MASYSSQNGAQKPTQAPIYPPRYPPHSNAQFNNTSINAQQPGSYPSYTAQQYPPQYPPQPNNYQQQQPYYQQPNQYPNYPPANTPYPPVQDAYNQYGQYPQQNIPSQQQQQYNPQTMPPPVIPKDSPLLRHPLSQIISFIGKNKQEFSQQFNKKFQDNEDFKSLNRKVVFFPSILIASHVILNRKKKWFRLTVNAPLIRYSLIGLFLLHMSTNVLYVAAFRDLIARNRDKVEKIIVREEFLGSGHK